MTTTTNTATLRRTGLGNLWNNGTATIAGTTYKINAKVYAEPSEYGIGGGRVSKLWVSDPATGHTYEYDRGDEWGTGIPAKVVAAVVELVQR